MLYNTRYWQSYSSGLQNHSLKKWGGNLFLCITRTPSPPFWSNLGWKKCLLYMKLHSMHLVFLKELYKIWVKFGPHKSPFLKCFKYINWIDMLHVLMFLFRRVYLRYIFHLFIWYQIDIFFWGGGVSKGKYTAILLTWKFLLSLISHGWIHLWWKYFFCSVMHSMFL